MSITLRRAIEVVDSILSDVDAGRRLHPPNAAQSSEQPATAVQSASNGPPAEGAKRGNKVKKDKKKGPVDASKKPWAKEAVPAAPLEPIQQADLRVAKIVAVEAVEGSDKLWKCQVDCGDAEPRQIVAGLQQFIPASDMLNRLVVAICNLKAAKLAGQTSEGMLLAASSPDKSVVRTIQVPSGSCPGDKVFCQSGSPDDVKPKVLKSKVWQEVVPKLLVKDGKPCHADTPLCTKLGLCTISDDVPDESSIS